MKFKSISSIGLAANGFYVNLSLGSSCSASDHVQLFPIMSLSNMKAIIPTTSHFKGHAHADGHTKNFSRNRKA